MQLHEYMLACPSWRALSSNAKVLYPELKRLYDGKNNGDLAMSSRDAGALLNGSHHMGARALTELQEHGLIAITAKSNFARKVKLATLYRLTEARDDRAGLEAPPTKDFMKWRPSAPSKSSNISRTGEIHSRVHETEATEKAMANA